MMTMEPMIVQIYALQTPEEAAMVAELGADHIGVVVGEHKRTPDEVDFAAARAIFAVVPAATVKVALTVTTDLAEIERMVRAVQPDILHLSSSIQAPDVAATRGIAGAIAGPAPDAGHLCRWPRGGRGGVKVSGSVRLFATGY